jgi:F-type H+-transporting ATPase subunit b
MAEHLPADAGVSELTATTEVPGGAGHHAEPSALGLGPSAWVALSMTVVILVALYFKVPRMITGMLDKRIDGIRHMLDEAAVLRKEAEALKAEYEKKVADATRLAAEFKVSAEHEAKMIIEKARVDAAELVARREKMAEEKIAAAERAAIDDLRAKAAEAASVAARGLIREKHTAEADKALVDQAIAGI